MLLDLLNSPHVGQAIDEHGPVHRLPRLRGGAAVGGWPLLGGGSQRLRLLAALGGLQGFAAPALAVGAGGGGGGLGLCLRRLSLFLSWWILSLLCGQLHGCSLSLWRLPLFLSWWILSLVCGPLNGRSLGLAAGPLRGRRAGPPLLHGPPARGARRRGRSRP